MARDETADLCFPDENGFADAEEPRSLRVQLWSYNYAPEPTGIGPVSAVLALALKDRGHEVEVVAAHPHYPEPVWGFRRLPYKEIQSGIPVLRLPLWSGRASAGQRYRQELTFMASQFAALPFLGRPDVMVSVSPSFPAVCPAVVNARLRRLPLLLWLQDILPDGAMATGVVRSKVVLNVARRVERMAYREADLLMVPSRSFAENLVGKGVPRPKIRVISNPATRKPQSQGRPASEPATKSLRILSMGNIGFSQGLIQLVRAFESSPALSGGRVKMIITGEGVASRDLRDAITSDQVVLLGLVGDQRLEAELQRADVALVSQAYEGADFNIPSKLMNFMNYGLPVIAAVDPDSEVARIVREAKAGWVVDSAIPENFPDKVAELLADSGSFEGHGASARRYAEREFMPEIVAGHVERAIRDACRRDTPLGSMR